MYLLKLLMFLSFTLSAGQWVIKDNIYHGKTSKVKSSIPKYIKGTIEYKILQTALDIENIIPTMIDKKYEKYFLSNIPEIIRENFKKRNATYPELAELKKQGKVVEVKTGFLKKEKDLLDSEQKILEKENENRKKLYSLIAKHLKLKPKDKNKVAGVYHNALMYQKYYALVDYKKKTSSILKSEVLLALASSYKIKTISKRLEDILKEEKYEYSFDNNVYKVNYTCENKDEVFFLIKICEIKNKNLKNCENNVSENIYSHINSGTLVWAENIKDKNGLKFSSNLDEDQELIVCKNQVFDVFDRLSKEIINED
jgi:uncharacterized protein YdbL (DUF1318 family)